MKRLIIILFLLIALPCYGQKITDLPENTSPTSDDLTVIVNAPGTAPVTQKTTLANLAKGLGTSLAAIAAGTWAGSTSITTLGTIANAIQVASTGAVDNVLIGTAIGSSFPTLVDINLSYTTSGDALVQSIMGVRGIVTGTAQQQILLDVRGSSRPTVPIDAGYAISAIIEAVPLSAATMNSINAVYAFTGSPSGSYSGTLHDGNPIFIDSPSYLGVVPTEQRGIFIANQGHAGVTNAYGIYIEAPTGASGFNYSLEARGASNFYGAASFEGGIAIGARLTPTQLLELVKSANHLQILETVYSTTDTHQPVFGFQKSSSATIGTIAETASGESLGQISFKGVNSSSAFIAAALIKVEQDGAAGATYIPGRMIFSTATSAAVVSERMRLDSLGNFGIGVTSFGTSAEKVLGIGNGTAPSTSVANAIQIYSVDSSDATATLGLFLEQAVEDIGTFTAAKKIKILLNGVEYWLQLDPV